MRGRFGTVWWQLFTLRNLWSWKTLRSQCQERVSKWSLGEFLALMRGTGSKAWLKGCSNRQVLSAGLQLAEKPFSTPAPSVNFDWHEIFDGFFRRSCPFRSNEKRLVGSTTLLLDTFEKEVQNNAATKTCSKQELSREELDLLDDVGLPQVFEQAIEDLSVDHAVLLCANLPATYLSMGIDSLIRSLLEKDQQKAQQSDVNDADHRVLADKIFELVKLSKGKNSNFSEETWQRLRNWLLNNGDALRGHKILQILCEEPMDLPQAKDEEETTTDHLVNFNFVDTSHILDTKCGATKNGMSNILDKVDFTEFSCKTRLRNAFYWLGKSASPVMFPRLEKLVQKGMPKDDMEELVDSFTKGVTENNRDIRRGVEVFKKLTRLLKSNRVSSFNLLIAHCANHGEIDLCIDLIQTMKARELDPCASSYEPLIKYFAKTLEISKAEDILQIIQRSGMWASVTAYASLVGAHARADNFERAYNLIEEIPCQDLTAHLYTPIIRAYGIKGQISQAFYAFHIMKRRNIKPTSDTFTSLIHACANGKDFQRAEKVFELYKMQKDLPEEGHRNVVAAMLRVYARCGNLERLEKMISCNDTNVLVTREAKSALLRGLSETGRIEEALKVYNDIRNGGGYPNSEDFCTFLRSLGTAGEIDQLLALFEPFRKSVQARSRVFQEALMSHACSNVVHALILYNHLDGALDFLQKVQLEDVGDVETLCLKVFVEDKASSEFPKRMHLGLKDKIHFLKAMREKLRIQPTRLAYESLLESCAKEKDAYHAESVLLMMRSDKLQLNVFTYMLMLRIVICRGDFKRATVLASEMNQTMKDNGLSDKHVKFMIRKILESGKFTSLIKTLYAIRH